MDPNQLNGQKETNPDTNEKQNKILKHTLIFYYGSTHRNQLN